MKSFILSVLLLGACCAQAVDPAKTLQDEFTRLHEMVQNLKPEFEVGGYLKGKRYGDVELLWNTNFEEDGTDVIRIYHEHKDGTPDFSISFHRSHYIVDGYTVIRRFVGPMQYGWRNDTVDILTGRYLGTQGVMTPEASSRDLQILKEWQITLFE